jgi:DNA-binding beta-propeller fold protein YncE
MSIARLMQQAAAGVPSGVVWTDPDLANASYDGVSVNQEAGSELTSTVTIFRFKPDGLRCYIGDIGSDSIHQYDLSTAWDLSTSSLDTSFSVSSQETQPRDIAFSNDGTTMFMLGSGVEAMFEYSLSTAWDVGSATYTGVSFSSWPTVSEEPTSVAFNDDGSKCYVADYGVDEVWQYSLSTAYDLSTISYDSKKITSLTTYGPQVSGIFFSPTGDKLFVSFVEVSGGTTGGVFQFNLSTNFDISTASYSGLSFVLNEDCSAGLEFKSDGSKAYNALYTGGSGATYQYSTD